MNTRKITAGLLFIAAASIVMVGCSALQRPPSRLEQKFFDVQTNQIPYFKTVTNVVVVTVTNENQVPVFITNKVVEVVQGTNYQYIFTPNTNAALVGETGGAIGNLFGAGGLVTTVIAGLFGVYASMRSKQKGAINNSLAQGIETARSLLLTTPKGQELDKEFVAWLVKHQAEAGIFSQVSEIVSKAVDAPAADEVANAIKALISGYKPPTS